MLVGRVLGVQQILDSADWKTDLDPILSWSVVEFVQVDTVVREPLMNGEKSRIAGLDKLVDFVCSQMLAISAVRWVRDYYKQGLSVIVWFAVF